MREGTDELPLKECAWRVRLHLLLSLKKIFKKNLKKVLTNHREYDIINTESEREISTK